MKWDLEDTFLYRCHVRLLYNCCLSYHVQKYVMRAFACGNYKELSVLSLRSGDLKECISFQISGSSHSGVIKHECLVTHISILIRVMTQN